MQGQTQRGRTESTAQGSESELRATAAQSANQLIAVPARHDPARPGSRGVTTAAARLPPALTTRRLRPPPAPAHRPPPAARRPDSRQQLATSHPTAALVHVHVQPDRAVRTGSPSAAAGLGHGGGAGGGEQGPGGHVSRPLPGPLQLCVRVSDVRVRAPSQVFTPAISRRRRNNRVRATPGGQPLTAWATRCTVHGTLDTGHGQMDTADGTRWTARRGTADIVRPDNETTLQTHRAQLALVSRSLRASPTYSGQNPTDRAQRRTNANRTMSLL